MKNLLLLLTLLPVYLFSAIFGCRKAGAEVEKLTCLHEELLKLDDELGKAYKEALSRTVEAVFLYEFVHNYLMMSIAYLDKKNVGKIENFTPTQKFNIERLSYETGLGKIVPEGFGFFDFNLSKPSAFAIIQEPYSAKIYNQYFIAIFGLRKDWSEIGKMPLIYTMSSNENKVAPIKFNSDNSASEVCILERANPNTKKYLKYTHKQGE
jgi:hypothetical protein